MTKINFTGGIDQIKRQIEETIATYELLGNKSSVNFEKWINKWETGFPEATENRVLGNYQLTGENAWRADIGARPRFRQWENDEGIITGEYWRDRENDAESVPVSGTAEMCIDQIVKLEHQKNTQVSEQPITSDIIRYSGIPEITLFFRGRATNIPTEKQVTGEKSFRLMGYTDSPMVAAAHQNLELITQTDINRIGTKIKSIFRTAQPYIWSKGKKQVIYHDWSRGYNLNVYTSSYAEGERLVAAILAIRDLQIDETFLKYKEAKNPAKAYPSAQEIQVLGEKHKTAERLPKADVEFQYAQIYLPTIKEAKLIS